MTRTRAAWRTGVAVFLLLATSAVSQASAQTPNDIRSLERDIRPLMPTVLALQSTVAELEENRKGLDKTASDVKGNGLALVKSVANLDKAMTDLGVKQTETEIRVDLSSDVLFDFDKWNIKPEASIALRQTALVIAKKRAGQVRITGHTDSKGTDAYNQRLSERRAESVKRWMVELGAFTPKYFSTKGVGERYPVAPNERVDGSDNPEGRSKNRRVEIIIETVSRGKVSKR
jgi:outer membrane protein OmpA-like peptidoglycan-associated protein